MNKRNGPSGPIPAPSHPAARRAIAALPALPSHVRYLDEYDDEWKLIQHPADYDCWRLEYDTSTATLDFSRIEDADVKRLLKHIIVWLIHGKSPATVLVIYRAIMSIGDTCGWLWFLTSVERPVFEWQIYWDGYWRNADKQNEVHAVKMMLHFLCEMCLGGFRPGYADFVRSLPFKWRDNYRGVISGESILAADEEAAIIAHLDTITEEVVGAAEVTDEALTKACLLCISHQYGLRPVQIARINLDELRIYLANDGPMVHFLAYRAKKQKSSEKTSFVCKIKHEWAPLFVEYHRRRRIGRVWQASDKSGEGKLFPMTRAVIITAIGDSTEALSGVHRTATDLRHTAAQRMADAGASMEEVAAFLGHSHTDTSLSYFEASSTQAEKVNKALAISPIYSAIHRVAETRTIDKAALLGLPSDKQIGAVPHGIPIAGIGGCDLGQSLCTKNPVLSCYTCRKFLPLAEPAIHKEVLDHLRPVVRFFFDESLGDDQSPAFVQLRVTLEQVQLIIKTLEDGHE
jgi:integrase